jgi:peptidoglycan hydrolase CwlO-like protein
LDQSKATLDDEIDSIDSECRHLTSRRNKIKDTTKDMKKNVKRLREEIDEIEEKELRARIKDRECDLEKLRLEAELRKYVKHGK